MGLNELLPIVMSAVFGIWAILQVFIIKRLEHEVHQLNSSLDQTIQRLQRAREIVTRSHCAYVFMIEYKRIQEEEKITEVYIAKYAEHVTGEAELRGLAVAIDDKELLEIVNRPYANNVHSPEAGKNFMLAEASYRLRSQQLHTRISQLLAEETRKQRYKG